MSASSPRTSELAKAGVKLSEQIASNLSKDIYTGALRPGEKLPTEAGLSNQYQVSRSVIRESISMLRQDGLIISRQGSGNFVATEPKVTLEHKLPKGSLGSLVEILELRKALEAEAARLAAQRANSTQRTRIKNALTKLNEAERDGKVGASEDMALHNAIAEASNNGYFVKVLSFYRQFLYNAIVISRDNEAKNRILFAEVVDEHQRIVQNILQRQPEQAACESARHLENCIKRLHLAPNSLLKNFTKNDC